MRSAKLKPGQKLTVYLTVKNTTPATQTAKINSSAPDSTLIAKTNSSVKTIADGATSTPSTDVKLKYYVVQKGDSLWSIAQNNGVSIDQIKQWNNIDESYKIIPGQRIKIVVAG